MLKYNVDSDRGMEMKKEIIEWIKVIAISCIIAFVITIFVKPTIVKQYSMSPTLNNNDFLLINRFLYTNNGAPERGDIIVFKSNIKTERGGNKLLIKRVIAIPGDRLTIHDGQVYINEQLQEEEYLPNIPTSGEIDLVIPKNKLFAMGDNRGNSLDSRDSALGLVDNEDIIGKAFLRLYPLKKIGYLY